MPDLSQVRGRSDAQERALGRSDSILPSRRITEVAPVEVQANIRNAERGSPAQQLRETLGMVDQASTSLVSLGEHQFAATEQKNAEIAAGDNVQGTANPDLMKKSEAYRMVIAGGRADVALSKAEADSRTAVQDAIAQSANADPTKGDQVFGLDQANQIIEQTFRSHTLDSEGHPIDFGDPSANIRLYQGLAQVREHVLGQAAEAIRGQEHEKATNALANSVQADLMKGDTSTLERNFKQAATLGLDPKDVKSAFLASTLDAAMSLKSVDPITRALNSARPDGTPTWSAQEQATLLEAQHRMTSQFETEHQQQAERTAHQTMGNWALQIASGQMRLTPDMVAKANSTGQLDPQFNDAAFQLQHQFDAEAQQKLSWAREAQSFARGSAIQSMELQSLQAKKTAQGIIGSAMAGGLNGTQLTAALIKNRGSMDTEAFTDAMQFAKSIPDDKSFVQQTHAEDHLFELNAFLQKSDSDRKTLQAMGRRAYSDTEFSSVVQGVQFAFFNKLRTGANPDDALRAAILSTGLKPDVAQLWVNRAAGRQAHANMAAPVAQQMKGN